jgi:hypothetical protein
MKRSVFLAFMCALAACNKVQYSPKPDPFLGIDKMAAIMTDVYLIQGSFATNQKAYLSTGVLPHKFIYKKHKIDSVVFQKNFAYYMDRPEEYNAILKRATESLELQKTEVEEEITIENKEKAIAPVTDSLKEAPPLMISRPNKNPVPVSDN